MGGKKWDKKDGTDACIKKKWSYIKWLNAEFWRKWQADKHIYRKVEKRKEWYQGWRTISNRKFVRIQNIIVGGRRCSESWKVLRGFRENAKLGAHLTYIHKGHWEGYYKDMLIEIT